MNSTITGSSTQTYTEKKREPKQLSWGAVSEKKVEPFLGENGSLFLDRCQNRASRRAELLMKIGSPSFGSPFFSV